MLVDLYDLGRLVRHARLSSILGSGNTVLYSGSYSSSTLRFAIIKYNCFIKRIPKLKNRRIMPKMLSEPEESENYFTPKEIIIINKDGSPVAKAVYEHLTKLNILLNDWENLKKKGVTICKSISDLKLFECDDDEYPQETELLVEGLLESLDGFEDVVEGVEIIKNQMQALSKLQTTEEPVINTWSCFEIAEAVANIWDMAEKEFRVKKVITENLAHSRDEKLLHVFMGIWEMEPYFKKDTYAYLFAEVGLT